GNGSAYTAPTGSCTNAGANTDASGKCTITFSSPSAGQVTGQATVTLTVGGVSLTRTTGDGKTGDSANAVKTFVDANISIAASTTDEVNNSQTFTVTVQKNAGGGSFVPGASEHV